MHFHFMTRRRSNLGLITGVNELGRFSGLPGNQCRINFGYHSLFCAKAAADSRLDQKVVGFAAESQDLEDSVRGKLVSKKADMVVGNLLQDGFGTPDNTVFVADASGREERWAHLSKTDVAWRLLSWLLSR